MRLISPIFYVRAAVVFIAVLAIALIALPQVTQAQSQSNPFCWTGPPPKEVDCNDSNWRSLIETSGKGPVEQGKCYGFGQGVTVYGYDDEDCTEARGDTANQPPAQCFLFAGKINDYWSGNFALSALTATDCNGEFKAGTTFSNGTAYVKDQDGEHSSKPISEHSSLVESSKIFGQESSPASNLKTTENTGRADIACGGGGPFGQVNLAFDIGCRQQGNPIIDLLFAIIRILTTGVGFALVASIIIAGVQYTTASGDPNKTSLAKKRLVSTLLVALPLYLLTYAILNWIVPGAIF